MIIGITGYGYSGASAVIDLLKEYSRIQFLPGVEFQLLQQPDGILDLMHGIVEDPRRLNANTTITRFIRSIYDDRSKKLMIFSNQEYQILAKKYIDSLVQVSWKGQSSFDPNDIKHKFRQEKYRVINGLIRRLLSTINRDLVWPPDINRYFSFLDKEIFIDKTQKFFNELFLSFGFNLNDDIILEQLFSTNRPLSGAELFDGKVLSLIIDRDPRDIFLSTNILFPKTNRFMPCTGNVYEFVNYYRKLHSEVMDDRIIKLNFEDLIYRYDATVSKFECLLGRKNVNKGLFFKPELSINNTQLYKRYPQYHDVYEYIERFLPEYIYDFDAVEPSISFQRINTNPF